VYIRERTVDARLLRRCLALFPGGPDRLIETVREAVSRFLPR
jgi:hypothetical protein